MIISGSLLDQRVVSTPGTPETAFVAVRRTAITRIMVCNGNAAAKTFSVYHDIAGSAFSATNALYSGQTVAAFTTFSDEAAVLESAITLSANDSIGVDAGTAVVVSIYGITQESR